MAFIGSLEQFDLSNVLRRVEVFTKTGLLVVRHGEQWVELYFRQGLLVCIGPVRPDITLGDRLLQSGVIPRQALQEAAAVIGPSDLSETRIAITLIDLGYVNQNILYTWASKEAVRVLQILLAWSSGDIYFEDDSPPPNDRLLLSFSVTTLLDSLAAEPTSQPINAVNKEGISAPLNVVPEPPAHPNTAPALSAAVSDTGSVLGADRLLEDGPDFSSALAALAPGSCSLGSDLALDTDPLVASGCSLLPPQRVSMVPPPMPVDTSFMQPDMVMVPLDLSTQRERNPQAALTPEQWRLFTKADGQTSLQMACQTLGMSRELMCQLAGELTALGLIRVVRLTSATPLSNELSPVSRDYMVAGTANGALQPGYAASAVQPGSAAIPTTDNLSSFAGPAPIETQSQWGNGGNGAHFVLGGGWVLSSSQPVQAGSSFYAGNQVYVRTGGN